MVLKIKKSQQIKIQKITDHILSFFVHHSHDNCHFTSVLKIDI